MDDGQDVYLRNELNNANALALDSWIFQCCVLVQQRKPNISITSAAIDMLGHALESHVLWAGGEPDEWDGAIGQCSLIFHCYMVTPFIGILDD